MKLYQTPDGLLLEHQGTFYLDDSTPWDVLINEPHLNAYLKQHIQNLPVVRAFEAPQKLLAPIGSQEVWAAGVTYYKSREARMEEAEDGGDVYDRVYVANRPELFFKSPAYRVAEPGTTVYIRRDSTWNVPEPELTLVVNARAEIVGYTIGNDMSSRSIEGANPLYLPQAKVYDRSAAVGPCVWITGAPLSPETEISLKIERGGAIGFEGQVPLSQMKRQPQELVDYLFRACSFPQGCYLMTGTGIVPPPDFTLMPGDEISITIEPIGTLRHTVAWVPSQTS